MSKILPIDITANRESKHLIIEWNDRHTSSINFSLLRNACPCVECRGGHAKMGTKPDPDVFIFQDENSPRTELINIEAVGTYAITIEWADGHHFGIYNWEYLRALCPCADCRKEVDS